MSRKHLALIACLPLVASCVDGASVVTEAVAGPQVGSSQMPEFVGGFANMAVDFYKLEWTEDGYPGQLQSDGTIWEHPLYPIYVLDNYLAQYERQPSDELLSAISSVAHAAVDRMERHQGALVFWYESQGAGRLYQRHYSALTQGYYAERLWLAGELLSDDSLLEGARDSFRSLTIPHDQGGVLFEDAHGVSIAEVPQQPNSYILNGWQSALVSAWRYYLLSDDPEARDLVTRSAGTMAKLLPLYDAPSEANSRYGLTGFTHLRTPEADILDASVKIPSEGVYSLTDLEVAWANHRVSDRELNVILSLASRPEPVVVTLVVDSPTTVQMQIGHYDPLTASPVDLNWVTIGDVSPDSPDLVVSWEHIEAVVYPTTFVKEIDGKRTNVYHPIHIRRLRELHDITGDETFAEWADHWELAMCSWESHYPGLAARTVLRETEC